MSESTNEIRVAAARAKRQFPGHDVAAIYPIGWPVYTVRLTLTVLAEHTIATAARFILRLIRQEPADLAALSRLLGLSEKFVAGAAAELVDKELVVQRPDLRLEITEPGRRAIANGGRSWSPRREHMLVPFCPLTRRVLNKGDLDDLMYPDVAGKNGLFVLPAGDKPRLSELHIEAIRNCAHAEQGIKPEEITEVAEIYNRNARLRYRNDIFVIKMDAPHGDRSVFAAYRGYDYLNDETTALQRLAGSGTNLVPEEYESSNTKPWVQSRSISQTESELLTTINENDQAITEARVALSDNQNEREHTEMVQRIAFLEKENSRLTRQHDEQAEGATRLIKTEDHHQLLLEAIDKAQSEITLVSAWIGTDAFDTEVCGKLRQAMARGVQVRIAWGLGTRRGPEADRNRAKGDNALSALRRGASNTLLEKLTVNRIETHEKFIICDD